MCTCLKLSVPLLKGAFGRQNAPFWKGSLIWEQVQNSRKVAHLLLAHIARAGEVLLRTLFTQRDNGTTLARRLWESAHLRKSAEFMLIVFVRKSARFEAHYSFKKRPPWGAVESANGKRIYFGSAESAFILDLRKRKAHLFWICGKRIYSAESANKKRIIKKALFWYYLTLCKSVYLNCCSIF